MRKHGGTPSRRDKHVTLAAISPPGVARGRFVGGQQSGLAGCKPPPLFMRGASSCSSQGRRRGEPWGASPRPSAPTHLPTYPCPTSRTRTSTRFPWGMTGGRFLSVAALTVSAPSGHPSKDPPAFPPSTAFWVTAGGFPVDSRRRQRSISLSHPHSTNPHPSRVGVPTRLPDAIRCRPSAA